MIKRGLHRIKKAAVAGFRSLVPIERRAIERDASLAVPFAPGGFEPPPSELRLAVMCHLFHTDMCSLILDAVANLPGSADLLISTDTDAKRGAVETAFAGWGRGSVLVRVVENRGRDIAPKLVTFVERYPAYDLVLFLHTKKSQHFGHGDAWRDGLFRSLVGSPDTVASVLQIFASQPRVGMVIAQHFEPIREWIFWNGNFLRAWRLARRMGWRLPIRGPIDFPSGSMFWARPAALEPLIGLDLAMNDFPSEHGQINGTLHHAIERLFLFTCEHAGFAWIKVSDPRNQIGPSPLYAVEHPRDVGRLLEAHSLSLLPAAGRRGAARARPRPTDHGSPEAAL